jgi:hypothetical protein
MPIDLRNNKQSTQLFATAKGILVGERFYAPIQTSPGAHSASCKLGTGSYLWVECGQGVTLTPHPLLVPTTKNRVVLHLYAP